MYIIECLVMYLNVNCYLTFIKIKIRYPRVLASPKNGTNSEEFDEMESYLNQDLLIREFKNVEGLRNDIWSRAQITNNRSVL